MQKYPTSACNRSKCTNQFTNLEPKNTRLMFYLLANCTEYAGTVIFLQVYTYSGSTAKRYFQLCASTNTILKLIWCRESKIKAQKDRLKIGTASIGSV